MQVVRHNILWTSAHCEEMKLICVIVHANHRKRARQSHLHRNRLARLALPLSFTALYDRLSEIIQTHLVCSNFIICSLNTSQLLANIFLSLPSLWELTRGCIEPILGGVAIPPTDSCLCSSLDAVEALFQVQHSSACICCLSTNCR
jgi:hypothetical protein